MKDEGKRNTRETSLAKWHATESAFEAANLAIQVHGSYGYSAEYGIERYFRNARAPIIYEGTTQIHKMMQAEHALGYRRLNGHTGEMAPAGVVGAAGRARARLAGYSSPCEVVARSALAGRARLPEASSARRVTERRPCRCPGRSRSRRRATARRASAAATGSSVSLRTRCAPSGPTREDDAVARRELLLPVGSRSVGSPTRTISHSSSSCVPVVGERRLPGRELVERSRRSSRRRAAADVRRCHCQPGRSRPPSHSSPKRFDAHSPSQ